MADRAQPVAIPAPVAELVEAWNARSADRFVAVLDPGVRVAIPPLHLDLVGRDDVWVGLTGLFGAFGALRYTSRHRYLTPDGVTDEALLEGLQTQEFLGAPPTGRPGAVAARVIMRHDGYVVTRLEVWPDVAALRSLSDGVARRIDLRSAGPAAPVVAALRATIPAQEGKLSLGERRQQPNAPAAEGALLPGAPEVPDGAAPAAASPAGADATRTRPKSDVPKAPLPRRVRRVRAFFAGLVMLVVAGLLVTYVVQGVRNKTVPVAAKPSTKPTATRAAGRPSPSRSPIASPSASPSPSLNYNEKTKTISVSAQLLFFDLNSSKLRPEATATLKAVVQLVEKNTSGGVILVRGYTDSTGSAAYNIALSRRRAEAVATYLRQRLPAAFTVRPLGKGATQFKAANDTEEHRARNRRVEIKLPTTS